MANQNTSPTLNPTYNDLLRRWAAQGHPSEPECEERGCDLTGKHVHEGPGGWFCSACQNDLLENYPVEPSYREDFHADG